MAQHAFCGKCGSPYQPSDQAKFCTVCGAPLAPNSSGSKAWIWIVVGCIAAGAVVALIGIALLVFWPDGGSAPMPVPSGSSSSPSASAGWQTDTSLRNVTLPARSPNDHGCLTTPATLSNGTGSGTGVVGNGYASPVNISLTGDPLVGSFTPGGQILRVYGLSCYATDMGSGSGVMIDIAVTDTNGRNVAVVPTDVFNTVAKSIPSSQVDYFPMFKAADLKLTPTPDSVVFAGTTIGYAGATPSFRFKVTLVPGATAGALRLSATSAPA